MEAGTVNVRDMPWKLGKCESDAMETRTVNVWVMPWRFGWSKIGEPFHVKQDCQSEGDIMETGTAKLRAVI